MWQNNKTTLIVMVVVFLTMNLLGCGKRKNPSHSYAKEVTLTPPSQYELLFQRVQRAYKRSSIEILMDCISKECPGYDRMWEQMGEVFRRGQEHSLAIESRVVRKGETHFTYEVKWMSSHFNIYDDSWKTQKGVATMKVACGAVPRIIEITGSNPFLVKE